MPSVNFETDFNTAVIAWIKSATDLQAIWERSNISRPERPYVSLTFITHSAKIGFNDNIEFTSGTEFNIGGQRRMDLSLMSYSCAEKYFEAAFIMTKIQDSLENPIILEALRKAGLAVWEIGDILDVSAELESGFEPRAQMDISFGFASNRANIDVGTIDETKITGTFDSEDEAEITIP